MGKQSSEKRSGIAYRARAFVPTGSLAIYASPREVFNTTINVVYGDEKQESKQALVDHKRINRLDPVKTLNPLNAIYALSTFIGLGINVIVDKVDNALTGKTIASKSSSIPATIVKTVLGFPFNAVNVGFRLINDGIAAASNKIAGLFQSKKKDKEADEPYELNSLSNKQAYSMLSQQADSPRTSKSSSKVVSRTSDSELPDVRASHVKGTKYAASSTHTTEDSPSVVNENSLKK